MAASVFAQALCDNKAASLKEMYGVRMAFLDGVKWGTARERNAKFMSDKIQKVLNASRRIGLESPAKLLSDELDAVKLTIWSFEKEQKRLLGKGSANQLLLENIDEDVDGGIDEHTDEDVEEDVEGNEQIVWPNADEDDSDVVMGGTRITYDSDDDGSVYEL